MKIRESENGSALMIAVLLVTMLTLLAGSYLDLVVNANSGTQFVNTAAQAFYAAEAGVHRLIDQVNSGGASSVSGTLTNASCTSSYDASYDEAASTITSAATVATTAGTATRTVTVRTKLIPTYVRGAVTANGDATVKNNAVLDGRDYDSDGNLTGAPGTYGLSSTGDLTQQNSATVGGNGSAPANPATASTYQENASALSGSNPWDILGVTQAWFDANVTNTTSEPSTPLSGITYYTPGGDGKWIGADLEGSTGILIIHNADGDAELKNFTGTFKGLIIADSFQQTGSHAGTVLGGLVVTNLEKQLGGYLTVKYSSSILSSLGLLMSSQTTNWKKIISNGSWQEGQ